MNSKKQKLVIFDLDETLIHSMLQPLDRKPELVVEPLSVYVRPFAKDLIRTTAQKCKIAIWSAGSPKYVEEIAKYLLDDETITPLFIWDREKCTKESSLFSFQEILTKDLRQTEQFGFDLAHTVIIEDDPVKVRKFKDNAIIVKQYFGENGDEELNKLANYIDAIDIVDDITKLDKNLWNFNS